MTKAGYNSEAVGKRIRVARRNQNLTQAELAKKLEIDQSYISSIESGRREGTPQTLLAIARELGVTIEGLALSVAQESKLPLPDDVGAGLRDLVEDGPLSESLAITAAEVSDLATLRTAKPLGKNSYLQVLMVLRGNRN